MRSEFKRVKHGQIPGDYGRQIKIAMREKRTPIKMVRSVDSWVIGDNCAKVFRKDIVAKSKTVQRRRDKEAVKKGLED
jgi:phage gp16-like protein